MLSLEPAAGAIAAGNCCIIKPRLMRLRLCHPEKDHRGSLSRGICGCCGRRRQENTQLLEQEFDYIFFTGSVSVGRLVMEKAAAHLTPVTLELGGKSPCIVDKSADIKLAARRIVFGKYLNCGQTCVAPDYIYCHRAVKDRLIKEVQKQIQKQYGKQPLRNPNYGKIINEKHFDRILGLIDEKKVVHGGNFDRKTLRIEPTVLDRCDLSGCSHAGGIFGTSHAGF